MGFAEVLRVIGKFTGPVFAAIVGDAEAFGRWNPLTELYDREIADESGVRERYKIKTCGRSSAIE